jgi:hypothetical protein
MGEDLRPDDALGEGSPGRGGTEGGAQHVRLLGDLRLDLGARHRAVAVVGDSWAVGDGGEERARRGGAAAVSVPAGASKEREEEGCDNGGGANLMA